MLFNGTSLIFKYYVELREFIVFFMRNNNRVKKKKKNKKYIKSASRCIPHIAPDRHSEPSVTTLRSPLSVELFKTLCVEWPELNALYIIGE